MRRGVVILGLVAAMAIGMSACARMGVGDIPITLDNLTDTPVGLYVNGDWVGTYPAGASTTQTLGDHGGAPYDVEVRTESGAVLAELGVNEPQAASLTGGAIPIGLEQSVPCGIVRIVVGVPDPLVAPAPGEAVPPGPCP
ncbi:MAG: hypothetical protein ACSLFN_13495 [Candidatus Limnocylindrales bacterium]